MHEVANSLWKAFKRSRIAAEDTRAALESFEDLQIDLYELTATDVTAELGIANKLEITCYDASYVALAEKLKAPLITADERLYRVTNGTYRIMHLKDYV
jgi:predicted nucleic acid-binding protein